MAAGVLPVELQQMLAFDLQAMQRVQATHAGQDSAPGAHPEWHAVRLQVPIHEPACRVPRGRQGRCLVSGAVPWMCGALK